MSAALRGAAAGLFLTACPAASDHGADDNAVADDDGDACNTGGVDCSDPPHADEGPVADDASDDPIDPCPPTGGSDCWDETTGGPSDDDLGDDDCATGGEADACCPDCTTGEVDDPPECACFDTGRSEIIISCELPMSCGTVIMPSSSRKDRQTLTAKEEAANLVAMQCFVDAAAAAQAATLARFRREGGGQYEYTKTIALLESGDAHVWEHNIEDLSELYYPVQYRLGVGAALDCPALTDSIGQWMCIEDTVEAIAVQTWCTEEIEIDIGV